MNELLIPNKRLAAPLFSLPIILAVTGHAEKLPLIAVPAQWERETN